MTMDTSAAHMEKEDRRVRFKYTRTHARVYIDRRCINQCLAAAGARAGYNINCRNDRFFSI